MEQTTPVSELVVLSRRIEVEHELLHTWAGQLQTREAAWHIRCQSRVRSAERLSIDIRPDQIIVQLPHAQILGVEQTQVDVLAFENGLWNRISGQDVQGELSVLPELALEESSRKRLVR
jgi:hypothetical protein